VNGGGTGGSIVVIANSFRLQGLEITAIVRITRRG
jgi:hypothetical protein